MRKALVTLLALAAATPALAQSVQQSGLVTRGHLPWWITSGVVGDAGTSAESNLTTLGVTQNGADGICVNSDHITAAGRNTLCLGAQTNGPGTITLQNSGTAPAQDLLFVINGTSVTLPTGGGSFILGNPPYVAGHVANFVNSSGVIQDSGLVVNSGTVALGVWQGTPVGLAFGGTGATTAATARSALGLGSMATQNSNLVAITGGAITGMSTPTVTSDVATKGYVDANSTGLTILAQSTLATAAVLPNSPTYANGASGVGATLTAGSNTTLTVDSTAAPLNTVVLVKNQVSALQNGIYTVTTAGSGAAAWVLTRATYFDQAAEMLKGSYTFVTGGSTNAGNSYTLLATVATVGTDAVNWSLFSQVTGGVAAASAPQGRLTLASLVPVMSNTSCASAACTNQTTIYYDCYAGCGVPIYNGTSVASQQLASEVSDALPSSSTGVVNASDVFDTWWVSSKTICHATNGSGGGWSADTGGSITARGTGYTQLSRTVGFLVNANTITHCYNGATDLGPITASQATYLGTFATTASPGTVSYTFGSGTSGGGAAFFGLWNYYNRVTVTTNVSDTSAPYTYTSATLRQAGGSTGNQIQFVLGVAEDNAAATYSAEMTTTSNINSAAIMGLGFDSTTALGCQPGLVFNPANLTVMGASPTIGCAFNSTVGIHTIVALERSDGTHANTFNAVSANNLSFSLRM